MNQKDFVERFIGIKQVLVSIEIHILNSKKLCFFIQTIHNLKHFECNKMDFKFKIRTKIPKQN